MLRRVITAGLFGGLVMIAGTIVIDGVLGFNAAVNMKSIPNESLVYEILAHNVSDPGRYAVNPALTDEGLFPDDAPVFGVLYGGMGHEAAGMLTLIQLPLFLVLPILAAWLLTHASSSVLSRYPRKVVFIVALGLLIAASKNLTAFGIGGYPLHDAAILFAHDLAVWTAAALVMAWKIKPLPL